MSGLATMSAEGGRSLAFIRQKLRLDAEVTIKGANPGVCDILGVAGITEEVSFVD